MMRRAALPPELGALSSRQAFGIRAESWDHDVQLVLAELEPHVGPPAGGTTTDGGDDETTPAFTADDFRGVALGFDSVDISSRNATAEEIKEIAAFLDLDEVLAFSRSRKTAERVGAAIALGVHIRSSTEVRVDRRVLSSLGELLADGRSSRVRYRVVEVLRSSPALVPNYADELTRLAEMDPNPSVRDAAAKALRRARR